MTSRADPFYSAKIRFKRAKQHICRLEKRAKRFLDTVPYTNIIEPDADGVTQLHKIRFAKPLPASCDIAATEAIQALRDILDYIGAASAIAAGVIDPTSAKFPFGDTAAEVENDIRRGCKDLHPDIQALFRGFKPYERGNDSLWSLNKLRNPATHRILAPMVSAVPKIHFHRATILGDVSFCPEWDSTKNEITVARAGSGSQFHYDAEVLIFISFNDPEPVRGKPAVYVLKTIASEVDRVLRATEAECRRLGFIN